MTWATSAVIAAIKWCQPGGLEKASLEKGLVEEKKRCVPFSLS
jgi:hypothetical protein